MPRIRVLLGGMGIVVVIALATTFVAAAGARTARADRAVASGSAPARCRVRRLSITVVLASPGLSHHGYIVRFRNRGRACTLNGYPGVDALSARGQKVVSAQRTKSGYLGGLKPGRPIPVVRLARHQTAAALLEWFDAGSPCPHAHSLKITPPNAQRSVTLSPMSLRSETLCHLEIHPVVRGLTGQGRAAAAAASATSAATPACAAANVQVWLGLGLGGGTLGSIYYPLEFSNVGRHACTLRGYPGVSAIRAGGSRIGPAARRNGQPHGTVTIRPGGTAHALLRVVDWGNVCSTEVKADALKVYPPGATRPEPVPFSFGACAHQGVLEVGPVRRGVGIPGFTMA